MHASSTLTQECAYACSKGRAGGVDVVEQQNPTT